MRGAGEGAFASLLASPGRTALGAAALQEKMAALLKAGRVVGDDDDDDDL
jgi:hypothetical protein